MADLCCSAQQEREENVKADVFHAYLSLLKQTRPAQSWLADPDAMEQGDTPLTMLQSQVTCPPLPPNRFSLFHGCSTTSSHQVSGAPSISRKNLLV